MMHLEDFTIDYYQMIKVLLMDASLEKESLKILLIFQDG